MKEQVDLLEDVAPASNELGAISDMAQKMFNIQAECENLEMLLKLSLIHI